MKIFIIGSGNVASHLAKGFIKAQHTIIGIYSRNSNHANQLSDSLQIPTFNHIDKIPVDADFYFICVSDKAINEVTEAMPKVNGIVLHTAGSVDVKTLNHFQRYGVFYPLQTFSKQRPIDLKTVPFCLEANTPGTLQLVMELAKSISDNTLMMNSEQRLQCHLAAVFANNFVNHFYFQSKKILDEKRIDFNVLKPLILETALKAIEQNPENAQTGPASRGDHNVIERHLSLLNSDHLKKLYRFVSDSIMHK